MKAYFTEMKNTRLEAMTMSFNELPEFAKEFKKYSKKYLSLSEDLDEFKKVITNFPLGTGKHFNVLAAKDAVRIVKARFFCKYLKGSSMRIIYAYCEGSIAFIFIEIYFKGDKPNEDRGRISDFLKDYEQNANMR